MFSGTRANVNHTVRRTHGIFIMFHHNQTVTKIPKPHQCSEKLVIISLMKSDAWLIQNIGNSHKAGTNLCCKTDSLRLASGKGSGSPSKRKIFQPNFCQKSYSGTDFLQDLLPDQLLLAGKLQVMEKAL